MKPTLTLLVLLWCGVASAFTANDAARTILTDGTSTDTQAAENYVINKAHPHPLVSSSSLRIARVTTLRAGKTIVGP